MPSNSQSMHQSAGLEAWNNENAVETKLGFVSYDTYDDIILEGFPHIIKVDRKTKEY